MRHLQPILNRLHRGPARVAEIGCYRGQLAAALLRSLRQLHLTMVDPWAAPDPGCAYLRSGDRAARQLVDRAEEIYAEAMLATRFADRRRRVLRLRSIEASERIENHSLDLVFIDAEHTYQAVNNDLAAWWPKVRAGGWLGGHDYRHKPPQFEVKPAVDRFAANQRCRIEIDAGKTWFIRVADQGPAIV